MLYVPCSRRAHCLPMPPWVKRANGLQRCVVTTLTSAAVTEQVPVNTNTLSLSRNSGCGHACGPKWGPAARSETQMGPCCSDETHSGPLSAVGRAAPGRERGPCGRGSSDRKCSEVTASDRVTCSLPQVRGSGLSLCAGSGVTAARCQRSGPQHLLLPDWAHGRD